MFELLAVSPTASQLMDFISFPVSLSLSLTLYSPAWESKVYRSKFLLLFAVFCVCVRHCLLLPVTYAVRQLASSGLLNSSGVKSYPRWSQCPEGFISDMCSQLEAGSRSTNLLTNVPRIFRMKLQHVPLAAFYPAPHHHHHHRPPASTHSPIFVFSCVHVCVFIDKRSAVVNSLLIRSLWLLQLFAAHPLVCRLSVAHA